MSKTFISLSLLSLFLFASVYASYDPYSRGTLHALGPRISHDEHGWDTLSRLRPRLSNAILLPCRTNAPEPTIRAGLQSTAHPTIHEEDGSQIMARTLAHQAECRQKSSFPKICCAVITAASVTAIIMLSAILSQQE